MHERLIPVRVTAASEPLASVRVIELRPIGGGLLPPFDAGAHVELRVPGVGPRSYSLAGSPADRSRYRIAVGREHPGRGGSRWLLDDLQVGDELEITEPRNHFALEDGDAPAILIGGGIGITPLVSMAHELASRDRPWTMWHIAHTEDRLAFADELAELAAPARAAYRRYVTGTDGRPDLRKLLAEVPADATVYCCGPIGMIDEVLELAGDRARVEHFEAIEEAARDGGFDVVLRSTGQTVRIAPGETILDALITIGVDVDYSCAEGTCGTCETRVLAGRPDHRDAVLTDSERASGRMMMICCSGCLDPVLELDL